jgi:hypothetical protein
MAGGERPEALQCPVCGAALEFKPGREVLTCEYCATPVRVGADGTVTAEEKTGSASSPEVVVSQVAETVDTVADTVENVSQIVTQASNLASLPMRFLRAARSVIAGCLLALVILVVIGFLIVFFLVKK